MGKFTRKIQKFNISTFIFRKTINQEIGTRKMEKNTVSIKKISTKFL